MPTHFSAPWSSRLKLTTWGTTAVLILVGFMGTLPALLAYVILVGSVVFSVRGYTVTEDAIFVHRLGWALRLPLQNVRRARVAPGATRGSLRTFGNGGLFSFSGRYRNQTLGPYRAYMTDAERTVVVETTDGPIVVTPDRPDAFAAAVKGALKAAR